MELGHSRIRKRFNRVRMRELVGFGFLILLMHCSFLLAQESSPDTILIKNVRLIDPVSRAEDHAVNILI